MKRAIPLLLLLLALTIAACGGAPAEEIRPTPIDTGGEGGGAADEGGGVGGSLTLRLWVPADRAAAYEALAAAYTAANPGVTIQLEPQEATTYAQTAQTALAGGPMPDLVALSGAWLCGPAAAGALAEAPAGVVGLADAQAALFPAALGSFVCGGRLYGLPQTTEMAYGVALVNRSAAEAIGRGDVANGWANWDALLADARALAVAPDGTMSRAGLHPIGVDALPAAFFSLIAQQDGQYRTASGALAVNTPQGAAALALLKRLVDEGAVNATAFNEATAPPLATFLDGRSAMSLVLASQAATALAARPDVAATTVGAPLPVAGSPAWVAAPGWGLAVGPTTGAPDVAWAFVRFAALDPANAAAWNQATGTLPALRAAAEGEAAGQLIARHPSLAPWLPLLPAAQEAGFGAQHDRLWRDVTYPRLLAFLQGAATAEQTLAAIDTP